MASINLTKVIEKFKWENLTPEIDISKIKVTQPDINRPALQLAGYFEHFETTRLQIVGFVEYSYMNGLDEERQREIFEKLLNNPLPGIIFCRELHPNEIFREVAVKYGVPSSDEQKGDISVYGGSDPLAEREAGTLHFRARRAGRRIR